MRHPSMLVLRSLTTILLFVTLCFSRNAFAQGGPTVITNAVQILKMSAAKARENHPVRLRAVVTCYIPESQLCFVQDETAGIYVHPAPWPKELAIGQVVEVEGVTGQGRFSPIVSMGKFRPTNQKRSIAPVKISLEELTTGRFDCQYVEVEAVVQRAFVHDNVVELTIALGNDTAKALIFSLANPPTNTVDSRVRLRGVAGTFYSADQLYGFGLFLQDASFCEILQPPPEPFSQPLRTTANLAFYSPEGGMDHRIRLRGAVSFIWPNEFFVIRDEDGSLLVNTGETSSAPSIGDLVEVTGFIRNPLATSTALNHALWKKVGTTSLPSPKLLSLADLKLPPRGQSLAVEGRVVATSTAGNIPVVVLEDDSQILRAFVLGPVATNIIGSIVRIGGVYAVAPETIFPYGLAALFAKSENIEVIQPALAAAAPQKSSRLGLAALCAVALVCAAFAWSTHKNCDQARQQATSTSAQLTEAEKQVSQLRDSRERLGRDLHDHIIQSIYAVGLNLEDCKQSLPDSGKAETRIKSALNGINEVIRELRSVISGLETNIIQPREFRTALKSLALMLSHEKSSRIRLDLDQNAIDALTPPQATELVHVAREALSNSIRHGHAETTTVSFHQLSDGLRFAVEDDGKGFNAQAADTKGYGLRNMAKRAENLGAKFTIQAQEGLGTRILLDIPKQKHHFSTK